jgi:RHH-type rel operon transcriptional repressor/antitoxin RelB
MDKLVEGEGQRVGSGVVRISRELDERLTRLAEKTNRSKAYYARKAIETFLDDHEDYLTAVAALEASKERVSLREFKKRLDLDN